MNEDMYDDLNEDTYDDLNEDVDPGEADEEDPDGKKLYRIGIPGDFEAWPQCVYNHETPVVWFGWRGRITRLEVAEARRVG